MNDKISYFFSHEDEHGYIHSIDMIYLEGFGGYPNFKPLCDKYGIFYDEGISNRKNKYLSIFAYFNFDIVGLDLCEFIGKGERQCSYDDFNEVWDIKPPHVINAPYWVLRFNPNKLCSRVWFYDFIKVITDWESLNKGNLFLKKFDYAIDTDIPIHKLMISSRKKSGRYDTTLYFGRSGRSGYLKIYDKVKEIKESSDVILDGVITRIEYTFNTSLEFSFDKITTLTNTDGLNATDLALLQMYEVYKQDHPDYDLSRVLGYGKWVKLRNSCYSTLSICDSNIMMQLLNQYLDLFCCLFSGDNYIDIPLEEFSNFC